jgi:hypothetical protein
VENWLNEAVLVQFNIYNTWINDNVTSPTWSTTDGTGWNSVADLNENRHILRGEMDELQRFFEAGASMRADDYQKSDWAQHLEDYFPGNWPGGSCLRCRLRSFSPIKQI